MSHEHSPTAVANQTQSIKCITDTKEKGIVSFTNNQSLKEEEEEEEQRRQWCFLTLLNNLPAEDQGNDPICFQSPEKK